MKIEQKKYTQKVKISTLRLLEKNDFNYLKTEKLTKVGRSTIKRWEAQLGDVVYSGKSPSEIALVEVDIEMKRNDIKIIKQYYQIRRELLERIQHLIPIEKKLEPLITALKNISLELAFLDEISKKEQDSSTVDIMQTILKNIEKGDFSRDNSMVD